MLFSVKAIVVLTLWVERRVQATACSTRFAVRRARTIRQDACPTVTECVVCATVDVRTYNGCCVFDDAVVRGAKAPRGHPALNLGSRLKPAGLVSGADAGRRLMMRGTW